MNPILVEAFLKIAIVGMACLALLAINRYVFLRSLRRIGVTEPEAKARIRDIESRLAATPSQPPRVLRDPP